MRFNNGLDGIMRGLSREAALAEAYAIEPLVLSYPPVVVKAHPGQPRNDLSRDVVLCRPTFLSNGNGPTCSIMLLNLCVGGTVRYHDSDSNSGFMFVEHSLKVIAAADPQSWNRNAPTWRQLFYAESQTASLAWLLAWNRCRHDVMKHIDRPIAVIIAKYIYASYADQAWSRAVR